MAASQTISSTLILLPLRLWVGAILTGSEIIASNTSRDQYEIFMSFLRSASIASPKREMMEKNSCREGRAGSWRSRPRTGFKPVTYGLEGRCQLVGKKRDKKG